MTPTGRSGARSLRGCELLVASAARVPYSLALQTLYYSGVLAALLRARRKQNAALILCYHGVQEPLKQPFDVSVSKFVTPQAFERQMRFLKQNFPIVPLQHVVHRLDAGKPFERMVVVITFDDGYRNTLDHAYPLMERYQVPASVFLATGYIGNTRQVWWNEAEGLIDGATGRVEFAGGYLSGTFDLASVRDKWKLFGEVRKAALFVPPLELEQLMKELRGHLPPNGNFSGGGSFLSWEEVRELGRGGLVELGSHTVTHAVATRLPQEAFKQELRESREAIESAAHTEVRSFAYPFGQPEDYSPQTAELLKQAGYQCGLTTDEGVVHPDSDPFQMKRVSVSGSDSWPTFMGKIAGIEKPIRRAGRAVLGMGRGQRY